MSDSKKILIVEDYADIAKIYTFVLEKQGYNVEVAKDGKSALQQVLSFQPDLILLDIMIPDIDGLAVLKTIRSKPEYKDIQPLVLVTTNVLQQDIADKAAMHGADGYVLKARMNNKELLKTIEDLLEKGKSDSDSVEAESSATQ